MNKSWFVILILSLFCRNILHAQIWSQEDSIKLANMLAGKDSLRLNPEYQRAIRNGTFINTNPAGKMRAGASLSNFWVATTSVVRYILEPFALALSRMRFAVSTKSSS